ncbi:hypothetical protein WBP06_09260 [Novosphingobium sp. BL-8H]|uniref:hypothetical protein n=1 Tax=Novosphingobium sp. BL-8H TaxID=3127640 RepID=UPI0037569215
MTDTRTEHTPGPWTTERGLPINRMPRVCGADRSLICEVGNVGTTQDQWEANAALIAAAPELLAFVERRAKDNPIFAKGHEKQEIAEAIALVAKARGVA